MEDKRVIRINIDVVVGAECDTDNASSCIAHELNRRGFTAINSEFNSDVTDFYKTHRPKLLGEIQTK